MKMARACMVPCFPSKMIATHLNDLDASCIRSPGLHWSTRSGGLWVACGVRARSCVSVRRCLSLRSMPLLLPNVSLPSAACPSLLRAVPPTPHRNHLATTSGPIRTCVLVIRGVSASKFTMGRGGSSQPRGSHQPPKDGEEMHGSGGDHEKQMDLRGDVKQRQIADAEWRRL